MSLVNYIPILVAAGAGTAIGMRLQYADSHETWEARVFAAINEPLRKGVYGLRRRVIRRRVRRRLRLWVKHYPDHDDLFRSVRWFGRGVTCRKCGYRRRWDQ